MANLSYHDQYKINTELKLRERLKSLPPFVSTYLRGIEPTTSIRTRNAYAYDINIFLNYLKNETNIGGNKDIKEWDISVMDKVTPLMIQDYLDYLKVYSNSGNVQRSNSERGLSRKLSSVRSFYNYFYRMEILKNNPAAIVRLPKLHEKDIVRLDSDEVEKLLDEAETGKDLTKQQQNFHEKTKVRDLAILTLLLGTGIRVSECVGLDLNDVDFKNHGIKIVRKGGNQVVVYFGDEVEDALLDYMRERMRIVPLPGHENALFISLQNKRISVRSVELLVKKYAGLVTQLKNITPHKLRSTYGTQLYKESGDIYLVADVLGHSDVNTTKKHYAAMEDSRRRMARDMVSLRSENGEHAYERKNIEDTYKDLLSEVDLKELSSPEKIDMSGPDDASFFVLKNEAASSAAEAIPEVPEDSSKAEAIPEVPEDSSKAEAFPEVSEDPSKTEAIPESPEDPSNKKNKKIADVEVFDLDLDDL